MDKQIQELHRKETTRVKSISFHPVHPVLITGNHCGAIHIWNYHYGQIVATLREHIGSVRAVKFHPSGEIFASGGDDKIVRVWNYKTKELMQIFKGHSDYIRSVDFHPTHPWLVSGSDDYTIKIWNYYTGEMLCTSSGHNHYIMDALFLDSTHIATASLDHTIGLWNCSNLLEKTKRFMVPSAILYQTIEAHDRGVNALFFRNGELLSGADDKEIKVWKYSDQTLVPVKTLYAQEGNVTSVYAESDFYAGVSEDGCLVFYSGAKSMKMELGTRLWTIAGKDGYLAVGSDDGLLIYRYQMSLLAASDGTSVYYTRKRELYTNKSDRSIYKLPRNAEKISVLGPERVLIQYDNSYEIVDNGRRIEGDQGQAAASGKAFYRLHSGVLYVDGHTVADEMSGSLYGSEFGVFLVNGKTCQLLGADGKLLAMHACSFAIKDLKAAKNRIALIGNDKIHLLDEKMHLKNEINERVEITGGFFSDSLLQQESGDTVFVYATIRQLKYFYEEAGMLLSVASYTKPIAYVDGALIYLSASGVEKTSINIGELLFRKAVASDENILSVIEQEHLPGLSPLKYLIKKGKGAIAMPYIKDRSSRFALFLSDSNFDAAFELCDNAGMYNDLAMKALAESDYGIAERCFKKMGDGKSLFFLYLSTRQLEKLRELEGEEVDLMVKMVLEDPAVFRGLGVEVQHEEAAMAAKVGDLNVKEEIAGREECRKGKKTGNKGGAQEAMGGGKAGAKGGDKHSVLANSKANNAQKTGANVQEVKPSAQESSKDLHERGHAEVGGKYEGSQMQNISLADERPVEAKMNGRYEGSQMQSISLAAEKDRRRRDGEFGAGNGKQEEAYSSDESADLSNRTSIITLNDSEPRMSIFDPSLLHEGAENEAAEATMADALALTTEGKFQPAVDRFRSAISSIAIKMRAAEDFLEQRRKIGVYLWGLHMEISRKGCIDPEKSMRMALFFAGLPLEEQHSVLARTKAMNLCQKNGNYETARSFAKRLPPTKSVRAVLESTADGDRYAIPAGDLCYDTLCMEAVCKLCPMCFVKSKNGDVCGACHIGLID